jgi:hypothetical protein
METFIANLDRQISELESDKDKAKNQKSRDDIQKRVDELRVLKAQAESTMR